MYHGQGKIWFATFPFTGDCYVGQFEMNKKHGQGMYYSANGDTYEGWWKMGVRHGEGSFTPGQDGGGGAGEERVTAFEELRRYDYGERVDNRKKQMELQRGSTHRRKAGEKRITEGSQCTFDFGEEKKRQQKSREDKKSKFGAHDATLSPRGYRAGDDNQGGSRMDEQGVAERQISLLATPAVQQARLEARKVAGGVA
jgi:hypothetical protein